MTKVTQGFSHHLMTSCKTEESFGWHQISTLHHETRFLHPKHLAPCSAVIPAACTCRENLRVDN